MAVKMKATSLEERWDRLVQKVAADHHLGTDETEAARLARLARARGPWAAV